MLNEGGKTAVGNPALPAFTEGAAAAGQVSIAGLGADPGTTATPGSATGCPVPATQITIAIGAQAQGTAATDYPGEALPPQVLFTPE